MTCSLPKHMYAQSDPSHQLLSPHLSASSRKWDLIEQINHTCQCLSVTHLTHSICPISSTPPPTTLMSLTQVKGQAISLLLKTTQDFSSSFFITMDTLCIPELSSSLRPSSVEKHGTAGPSLYLRG